MRLEFIEIIVICEKPDDELLDLYPVKRLAPLRNHDNVAGTYS